MAFIQEHVWVWQPKSDSRSRVGGNIYTHYLHPMSHHQLLSLLEFK